MDRNGSGIFPNLIQTDKDILQIPLKNKTSIKKAYQEKMQQQRLLQQINSRVPHKPLISIYPSISMPVPNLPVQNQTTNKDYIVSCIIRAFDNKKLSVIDVAEIFNIDSEIVDEIQKYRLLKQMQQENGKKIDSKKVKKIEQKLASYNFSSVPKNTGNRNNPERNRFDGTQNVYTKAKSLNNDHRESPFNVRTSTVPSAYNPFPLNPSASSSGLNLVPSSALFSNLSSNSPGTEYQRLLSCKPPYKLDEKIRAVIEIIKKKPNLMQKEIIQILHEEYKISNVTQACMSRMLKKIHEMHGHCKIIRQAVEQGKVQL